MPVVPLSAVIADLVELNQGVADHSVMTNFPPEYPDIIRRIGPGQKLCNVRHAPSSVYTWNIPEAFGEVSDRQRLILETIARNRRHKVYGTIPNGNPIAVSEIERLSGLRAIEGDVAALLALGYLKLMSDKYDLKGAMFNSGMFKRPRWEEPSPTVLTNFHSPRYFIHPLADRPFSLRECARIQGFPDSFHFTSDRVTLLDGYRLVGNAVPVGLARHLSRAVLTALQRSRTLVA
jgi:DNA (cytosine-5)-methyltransferase 1